MASGARNCFAKLIMAIYIGLTLKQAMVRPRGMEAFNSMFRRDPHDPWHSSKDGTKLGETWVPKVLDATAVHPFTASMT